MSDMREIEKIGLFPENHPRNECLILKTTEDGLLDKKVLYLLQPTYTQRIRDMISGSYNLVNQTEDLILNFMGKSIKKQEIIKTDKNKYPKYFFETRENFSNLEFSDGKTVGPISTEQAIPTTILNQGDITVERELFKLERGPLTLGKKRGMTKYIEENAYFEDIKNIKFSGPKLEEPKIPYTEYSDYDLKDVKLAFVQRTMDIGSYLLAGDMKPNLFASIGSKADEYLMQLPMDPHLLKNVFKKFNKPEEFEVIKRLDQENILGYTSLLSSILEGAKIDNIYFDTLELPSDEKRIIMPTKCYINIENQSRDLKVELSPELGMSIWSQEFKPVSIRKIKPSDKEGKFSNIV